MDTSACRIAQDLYGLKGGLEMLHFPPVERVLDGTEMPQEMLRFKDARVHLLHRDNWAASQVTSCFPPAHKLSVLAEKIRADRAARCSTLVFADLGDEDMRALREAANGIEITRVAADEELEHLQKAGPASDGGICVVLPLGHARGLNVKLPRARVLVLYDDAAVVSLPNLLQMVWRSARTGGVPCGELLYCKRFTTVAMSKTWQDMPPHLVSECQLDDLSKFLACFGRSVTTARQILDARAKDPSKVAIHRARAYLGNPAKITGYTRGGVYEMAQLSTKLGQEKSVVAFTLLMADYSDYMSP